MKVWEQGADFKTELLNDAEVLAALTPAQIEVKIRPWLSYQACRYDFRPRFWRITPFVFGV